MERAPVATSAAEVRRDNAAADDALRELLARMTPDLLSRGPGGEEWTVREILAHLAEFPTYFADELERWLDSTQVVVGRDAATSAARNDALVQAPRHNLEELASAVARGQARLADVLDRLSDAHLGAPMVNVKYGEEPLTAYLQRYVVGHKVAHVHQLRAAMRGDPQAST